MKHHNVQKQFRDGAGSPSRYSRYRELQASVPGLEQLYCDLGSDVASICQPQSRVLIVGGGGGREIEFLARHKVSARLTVIDPSSSNLGEAETRAREASYSGPVEFVHGTVDDLHQEPKFDIVTLIFVLHSINNCEEEKVLVESVRSRMTKTGRLFLADMCFISGKPLKYSLAAYRDYARGLGTAEELIELEVRSVQSLRCRTKSSLLETLHTAGFKASRVIGKTEWYAAFQFDQ